jgi:hypothetical protein
MMARTAQGEGFVTVLRFVGAIAADAGNLLINRNLVEQHWQDRRVANDVVGDLPGLDLQPGGVGPRVHLPPLAAILHAVLLRRPLAFA